MSQNSHSEGSLLARSFQMGADTELQRHPHRVRFSPPPPSADVDCCPPTSHCCSSRTARTLLASNSDPRAACFLSPTASASAMVSASQCSCLSCQNRFCSLDCSPARHNMSPLQSHVHTLPDGEPLYKSLLRTRYPAQTSLAGYVLSPYHHRAIASGISAPESSRTCEFEDLGSHRLSSPILDKLSVSCPISRGANCYSYRGPSNEVTLYRWYLTRPVGCQTSDIGVGGFLSTRAVTSERVETAAIIKRLEERKLLTQSGVVINLIGTIDDCATLTNGFSIQMVHLFLSGFPHVWSLLVGTMSGSVSIEKNSNTSGKVEECQSLFFDSKEESPSNFHAVGNRDQVDAEHGPHLDGSKNMHFTSTTRKFPEIIETHLEPCEKRVLDDDAKCSIEKKGGVDVADMTTGTGIHTETLDDAKLSQGEVLATTARRKMEVAVNVCENLNKTDIPCVKPTSVDACEMESNGGQMLSKSHSSKRRKIGFESENEPLVADVSHRKESFGQFVDPKVLTEDDPGLESIPFAVDKDINTQDLERTRMYKKKKTKNGKQRKKSKFLCIRPRRSIARKVVNGKNDNGKDQLALLENIMEHNEKNNDENESGNDQEAPSSLNECVGTDQKSILDDEIQQIDKAEYGGAETSVSSEENEDKESNENSEIECDLKARMESCISRNSGSTINSPEDACSVRDPPTDASTKKMMKHILPPPLPSPTVSVSNQLVSKAFGLKTSRSGRILVPPLAHWRNQSIIRDSDGGIIAIQDGSEDTMRVDTGIFNFKPPAEARARKLQKWLSVTAADCFTKRLKSRKRR